MYREHRDSNHHDDNQLDGHIRADRLDGRHDGSGHGQPKHTNDCEQYINFDHDYPNVDFNINFVFIRD